MPTSKNLIFETLRAIILPVFFLILLVYLSSSMAGTYAPSDLVGVLHYDDAKKLIRILFVVVTCLLFYRLTVTLGFRMLLLRGRQTRLPDILRTLVALGYSAVAFVFILHIWLDGDITGILTFSSVIGVVVGLALRPIILDVFSGLSANIETAFQIDDWVSVEGANGQYEGWVEQINWRTTHLRTRSGNIVVCPNSYLSTSIVTNSSRPYALSRYTISVILPVDISIARAKSLLKQSASPRFNPDCGLSESKAPDVLIDQISGVGVEYIVRFWLDPSKSSYDSAIDSVYANIHSNMKMAGVRFALPRKEIHQPEAENSNGKEMSIDSLLELLASLDIFRDLSASALHELAASMELQYREKGETIVRQGDDGAEMFLISEGVLDVKVRSNGEEVFVGQMQPGELFGEISVLTGEPRTASIVSSTESKIYVISREAVAEILNKDPHCLSVLSRSLTERKLRGENVLSQLSEKESENERQKIHSAIIQKMRAIFRISL